MINNFAIFKNTKKEKETQPDYELSINVGTKEQPKYVKAAGIWMKDGQNGKFMSGVMTKPFQEKSGWTITEVKSEELPNFDKDSKGRDINPSDIPF